MTSLCLIESFHLRVLTSQARRTRMGLFSGLEKFGLGKYAEASLMEDKRSSVRDINELEKKKAPEKPES